MDDFSALLPPQRSRSYFGVFSFLFLVLIVLLLFYMGYKLVTESGHPEFGRPEDPTFDLIGWSTQVGFFVLPIYVMSLVSLVISFMKKETAPFKYISAAFHGFILISILYSIVYI